MPRLAALHGDRQQHGGPSYAMDWGKDVYKEDEFMKKTDIYYRDCLKLKQ